jgi:hypothetical protein
MLIFFRRISRALAVGLGSFILFHLFSVLGIFIAAAYPIWWLLFPQKAICISCRTHQVGEKCEWCGTIVKKDALYPKSIRSVFFNIGLLLSITLLSLGLLLAENRVITASGLIGPQKTAEFTLPTQRQYKTLEIFPLKIEVTGLKTPINAVQVDLGFDPTRLQVIKIDVDESFANIFIDRQMNNEKGRVRLTGGLPNPGFSGDNGTFATVYFQAQTPGPAQIAFLPSSLVMANDGKGTNILNDFQTINYLILSDSATQEEQQQGLTSLGPDVLGVESDGEKLLFFDDYQLGPDSQVLGATNIQKTKSKGSLFLKKWVQINKFVLSLWRRSLPI